MRPNIQTASGTRESQPAIGHSCIAPNFAFGDPGVRVAEFVNAFGSGNVHSVCDPSYDEVLGRIGAGLAATMDRTCVDPSASIRIRSDGTPDCRAIAGPIPGGSNPPVGTEIPFCTPGSGGPCWRLIENTACRGQRMQLCRDGICSAATGDSPIGLYCN
jgi:hypothetical protein